MLFVSLPDVGAGKKKYSTTLEHYLAKNVSRFGIWERLLELLDEGMITGACPRERKQSPVLE
jgi:hypothetical protein